MDIQEGKGLARLHGLNPQRRFAEFHGKRVFVHAVDAVLSDLAERVLFLSGDVSQLAEPGNTPVPRERVLVKPVELAELERRIIAFVRGASESA